jgi:hypothetical protein
MYIDENVKHSIEFKIEGYNKIRLVFDSKIPILVPEYNNYNLTCNGIIIPKAPPFFNKRIIPPHVQVFDFDGNLPINLGRNSLDTKFLPFENEIVNLIYLDFLEKLVSKEIKIAISANEITKHSGLNFNYPYLKKSSLLYTDFIYTKNGFIIKNKRFIENIDFSNIILIGCKSLNRNETININLKINDNDLVFFERTQDNFISKTDLTDSKSKYLKVALYRHLEYGMDGLIPKEVNNLQEFKKYFSKNSGDQKTHYYFGNINEQKSSKLDYIEIYNNPKPLREHIEFDYAFSNFLIDFFDDASFVLSYKIEERLEVFEKLKTDYLKKQSITKYKNNSLYSSENEHHNPNETLL